MVVVCFGSCIYLYVSSMCAGVEKFIPCLAVTHSSSTSGLVPRIDMANSGRTLTIIIITTREQKQTVTTQCIQCIELL